MTALSRRFYSRPTLTLAASLLGRTLVHDSGEGLTSGRIVEVEAYCGPTDPGSHAFRSRTKRNEVMFGPPGHLYVYFTYGMHFCCNVVSDPEGLAGAVLLRAAEPLAGIELMRERRRTSDIRILARGPGRLCQAFGISREHNGLDLVHGSIWIEGTPRMKGEIRTSDRIGLAEGSDLPWRFYEDGPWTSGPARLDARARKMGAVRRGRAART